MISTTTYFLIILQAEIIMIFFLLIGVKLKLNKESDIRKEQDWKLYNNLKSNFNTLIGKTKRNVSTQDEMKKLEDELRLMQKDDEFVKIE